MKKHKTSVNVCFTKNQIAMVSILNNIGNFHQNRLVLVANELSMDKFGICIFSVIPVRKEPSDKSEMTTQLLFGDLFQITYTHNSWYNIRQEYDNYEGWIDKKQAVLLNEKTFKTLAHVPTSTTLDLVNSITNNFSNIPQLILIGSSLPGLVNNSFYVEERIFSYAGETLPSDPKTDRNHLLEMAYTFKDCPYLWGGKTPFGIDCSGFTQLVYKTSGIRLLRDASQQAQQGETLNMLAESKPGDLAFFDNNRGDITHVGILISDNKIIHASGKVRIDNIDHQGIYNDDEKKYTHNLRVIKTLI